MRLKPKPSFSLRKTVAWLLIGVLNPLWWTLIFLMDVQEHSYGSVWKIFLLPLTVSAGLFLIRLKNQSGTSNELGADLIIWGAATVPIYILAICTWVAIESTILMGFGPDSIGAFLQGLVAFLFFCFVAMTIGTLIGFFPAMLATFVSYLIIRFTLYIKAPNSTQTP